MYTVIEFIQQNGLGSYVYKEDGINFTIIEHDEKIILDKYKRQLVNIDNRVQKVLYEIRYCVSHGKIYAFYLRVRVGVSVISPY
jgi:hypothetical protein